MSRPSVTGTGPWPGTDALEAQSVVVGDLLDTPSEVAGLPFTVTLAARGPWSDPVGRASALLADLPTELGAHGWKLAAHPGGDLGRAQSFVREDLDALAVAAHGYVGPLVVPVLGPDDSRRVALPRRAATASLSDAGAVRELAASLAAGLADHLGRAAPGRAGRGPDRAAARAAARAGHGRGAAVVLGVLGAAVGARAGRRVAPRGRGRWPARSAGASSVVVHGGTAWSSLGAIRASHADGFALAVTALDDRSWERVAEVVEGGLAFWPELPPQASSQCAGPDVAGQADLLLRPWRSVGLPAVGLRDVVLLAGDATGVGTPDDARGRARRARARRASRRRTCGVLMRRPLILLIASAAALVGLVLLAVAFIGIGTRTLQHSQTGDSPCLQAVRRRTCPARTSGTPSSRRGASARSTSTARRRRSSSRPRSPAAAGLGAALALGGAAVCVGCPGWLPTSSAAGLSVDASSAGAIDSTRGGAVVVWAVHAMMGP